MRGGDKKTNVPRVGCPTPLWKEGSPSANVACPVLWMKLCNSSRGPSSDKPARASKCLDARALVRVESHRCTTRACN